MTPAYQAHVFPVHRRPEVGHDSNAEAVGADRREHSKYHQYLQRFCRRNAMHYIIDVIHDVTDRQATCSEERRANARIALTLNAMIDMFGPAEDS